MTAAWTSPAAAETPAVVQPLTRVQLFGTAWTAAHQASLSFTISRSLLKLMSTESVMLSNISSFAAPFSYPQSFPRSGSLPVSHLSASGGQSIGASTSASVLPMNIQGQFPLGLTGLISLLSKTLKTLKSLLQHHSSKASILQHSAFFMVLTFVHDYWINYSFDYTDLGQQSDVCFL